ncbi:nitroreductase family protein [Streptomyces sp. NPDC055709]
MDFKDVVRKRKMIRSYTDRPVAAQVVRRILDTARRGPSAGFSQGVEFVVVVDHKTRQRIAARSQEMFDISGLHNFVAQAPVHVVLCVSPEVYRARYREPDKMKVRARIDDDALWSVPYWYTDAGAAMQLMLMAAVDEGIAAGFVRGDADPLRELLAIPQEFIPIGIILLGHAAPDTRQFGDVSTRRVRRPYREAVHEGRW